MIRANVSVDVCSHCKGHGFTWTDSHDCWGKSESYRTTCCICGGLGFSIKREDVLTIKERLKII